MGSEENNKIELIYNFKVDIYNKKKALVVRQVGRSVQAKQINN
jgi:hypothetical protein